ncbi:hypothetical protein TNCV_5107031 [Trichonephila clavipes]|uniref:Uncharacterized protein n=1 Tax=Trichonephila clavipes TaxID=2585209 RepID=A0A8X6R9S9_TRICX|nr:hypothetical protein TNCV_5107031 [Trichonephila clavipes]
MIPATDEKEAYKKLARVLETDENNRDIKKLLPSSQTECILNNNALFKISEKQELLVVPEMMQASVIKKVHSFRHFAVTKTEELILSAGHCQGSHQELTKERGFSERVLDAEVDDPGLKKERRERWPRFSKQTLDAEVDDPGLRKERRERWPKSLYIGKIDTDSESFGVKGALPALFLSANSAGRPARLRVLPDAKLANHAIAQHCLRRLASHLV